MINEQIQAYIYGHFSDEVSRPTLTEMLQLVNPEKRFALLGFSDYAKHVINNFPDNIVAVFDFDTRLEGYKFRDATVVHADKIDRFSGQIDAFLVCRYDDLVQFYDLVDRSSMRGTPILWPEDFDGKQGHRYNIEEHSTLYRYRVQTDRLGEPPTMMPRETIQFLSELMTASLRVAGDVAEIGVWQGGSAWNMAKLMQTKKDERPLHLFDFFDDHTRSNPEAIMCLDEIRGRFAFYPPTRFYRGMANDHMGTLSDRQFAFVHIDLGYQEDVMTFFWDRMSAGSIILMDNYGHIRASPGLFDKFFAARGYSVIRSPFSYQAFVVK